MSEKDKDGKITLKDAYEELWRCRDFELSHLWQRSVFLGAFLLAMFAGYGSVVLDCLEHGIANRSLANVLCCAMTVIGIMLSFFWIMMAKGSKAWYERYERAIYSFTTIAGIDEAVQDELIVDGAKSIIGFAYGDQKEFKECSAPVSNWLHDTKGGAYSPSKINIAIGHLSLSIWLMLSIAHILIAKSSFIVNTCGVTVVVNLSILLLVGVIIVLCLFLWYARSNLMSSVLREKQ